MVTVRAKFPLVLVDLRFSDVNEEEFEAKFEELRSVLEELACNFEVIKESGGDSEDLLLEADLIVLIGPLSKQVGEEDAKRIVSFVESGKGFFYAGNGRGKGTDSLNHVLREFGLKLNRDRVKDLQNRHEGSESLPISREIAIGTPLTKEVYEICLSEPSSLSILDYSRARPICYGSMSSYIEDLDGKRLAEGFPLLIAISEYRAGRVLVAGDSGFLNDEMIVLYDNRTFVKNALAWLLKRKVRKKRKIGGRILLYPSVSFDPMDESGFRRMAVDLYSLGYSVDVTNDVLERPDADVLILTDIPSSRAVIRNLTEFVEEGGGLIVLADRGRPDAVDRLNALLEGFGIRLKRTPVGGEGEYEVNTDHPVGERLKRAVFYRPLPMRLEEPAIGIVSFGKYGGSKRVMAASRKGRGAVVVFGEDWIFRDHSYWADSHYSLMRSAVEWLTTGAEVGAAELDRRIKILKDEVMRLKSEVERLRMENVSLKKRLKSLNGEETRVETLKRIVKVDEDVRETIERMERLGEFSIDIELARAVLDACRNAIKVAYDVFDEHPKAALERVNAVSAVLDAMRSIVERRSKLIFEERRESEDWV